MSEIITTETPPAVVENAELATLKTAGMLYKPSVNIIVALQYTNPSFMGIKDSVASLDADNVESYLHTIYSPLKKLKGQDSAMRTAIRTAIVDASSINDSNMLVLGKEKTASAASTINKMFVAFAEGVRKAISTKPDDLVVVSNPAIALKFSDFVKVGSWAATAPADELARADQAGFVCITVQIPELYDADDTRYASVEKVQKFLQNIVTKENPNTTVLLAVCMNPSFSGDQKVRDFAEELHENFTFFPRSGVESASDIWMPQAKKDLTAYLMPEGCDWLWVTSVTNETEEE
jgi:hypothetical protein